MTIHNGQGEHAQLQALFNTIIPEDEFPGAWAGGVRSHIEAQAHGHLAESLQQIESLCSYLGDASSARHGRGFSILTLDQRSALIRDLEDSEDDPQKDNLATAIRVAFEGYYAGTSEPAGWAMLGFDPDHHEATEPDLELGSDVSQIEQHYDVIVVGAGAGGGVAAAELSARGKSVLLIERSRPMRNAELRSNHLKGKRMQAFDVTAGPGRDNDRILETDGLPDRIVRGDGDGGDYGLVAMTLGGGTRVWQGMSWRFLEEDFMMASVYGAPEGSTLADWPFAYQEMEPYYDRVEWELGVSGAGSGHIASRTPRSRNYPMLPMSSDRARVAYGGAAERLGWSHGPIPFAINSVAREGRAACVRCHQCVGHSCPVNAKNGTQNTFIPRALASGACDLLLRTQVVAITHDGDGAATGVRCVVETQKGLETRVFRADSVVISAGAIETPRLLLASGLGNSWVGRNHHTHGIAGAMSVDAPAVKDFSGPGHSIATLDWMHREGLAWGGGVIFDMPPMYPLAKAMLGRTVNSPGWGAEHKSWMKSAPQPVGTISMVQEIPHAHSRISLDPSRTDRSGMPIPRLRTGAHPASREAADFMAARCAEWVAALGGKAISSFSVPGGVPAAEHSAGTVRLARDPANGACDERGLLFGTKNVYIADASLHPTNGGFNPGLTAMANAMRVAALIP